MKTYTGKNILIIAHVLSTVPAQDIKEYFLQRKASKLFFITHPLFFVKGRPGPYYEFYENGKLVVRKEYKNRHFPSFIQYAKDFFLTFYWIISSKEKWDLAVSLDNLNTSAALFLKTLRKIDKVIYFTIDFVPKRFNNPLLNFIYNNLEKLAVKYADITWNFSPRVAQGREKIRGMDRKVFNRQIVVPVGVWLDRVKVKKYDEIEKHTIVYAGGLMPHQGIQIVIDAMPKIQSQIKDVKLLIIGIGDYEKDLKIQVRKLKLESVVKFLGYMEKHEDVEKTLSSCGLAIAMYSQELSKWSYYGDPSKIKTYLAAGLPVVTTSLTLISKEIERRHCGLVVQYNSRDVATQIIALLRDEKKHSEYRENAIRFSKEFDWNRIFDNGLAYVNV